MTGMDTADAAWVNGMSCHAEVPSQSMLMEVSPAPRASAFFAHSMASMPVSKRPPSPLRCSSRRQDDRLASVAATTHGCRIYLLPHGLIPDGQWLQVTKSYLHLCERRNHLQYGSAANVNGMNTLAATPHHIYYCITLFCRRL